MAASRQLVVFLTICICFGCEKKPEGPSIAFEEESYDLGVLREDNLSGSHEFVFHNRGSAPLYIKEVKTSCSCATPEVSGNSILPGKTEAIVFNVNFPLTEGVQRTSAIVYSNDPIRPVVKLTILATIRPSINLSVKTLNLGDIGHKSVSSATFDVRVPNVDLVEAENHIDVTCSSTKIPIELSKKRLVYSQLGKISVLTYVLRIHAKEFLGDVKEIVTVCHKEDGSIRKLPLAFNVLGNLTVEPEAVFFGIVGTEKPYEKIVTITSLETLPINLLEAHATNGCFEVTSKKLSPHIYELYLKTMPEELSLGMIKADLVIHTDDELQPLIHIPIKGLVSNDKRHSAQ